jgi:F-type H+-transporting ATPase subunit epsilon
VNLKIHLPTKLFLEKDVRKISAESENGAFTLLPRHIDFVTAVVPGLLFYETEQGEEEFLAVDEGILVKCGAQVRVSVFNAILGPDLGTLQTRMREQFYQINQRERRARTALTKLEADFMHRYLELEAER